jgi:hypothetical protein
MTNKQLVQVVAMGAIVFFFGIAYLGLDDYLNFSRYSWEEGQQVAGAGLYRVIALLKSTVGLLGVIASALLYRVFSK